MTGATPRTQWLDLMTQAAKFHDQNSQPMNHEKSFSKVRDFTVLMACYYKDDSEKLRIALESIFRNSLKPDFVLLVGDGPLTPPIYAVINSFKTYPNFIFVETKNNMGLACALNFGIKFVKTKYIVRADSDDFNLPNRFSTLIDKIDEGFEIVGSAILEVDAVGNPISIRRPPETHSRISKFIYRRCPFNHMTVAFSSELSRRVSGYPNIYLREDYGMWIKMIAAGARTFNIAEVLVHASAGENLYRRRSGFKYAWSEIELQRLLVRELQKPIIRGLIDGVLRAAVFLIPNSLRSAVYRNFLRDRTD